jgi:hypothetical protein
LWDIDSAFSIHQHKLRLRVLLRALRLLALQELRVLHRPVMHSLMIIMGKMSTRASTRMTSQLISHLVVLGPTFAVHLFVRWYVMMAMLVN